MKRIKQKLLASFSFVLLAMLLFLTPGTPLESLTSTSTFSWTGSNPEHLETTYTTNNTFNFTSTWNSTNEIESANITHNFTGTPTTESATQLSNSTWYFEISNISAGRYVWSMTATDNESVMQSSPEFELVILRKQPNLTLKINGLEENQEIFENETITIDAILIEGSTTPKLYVNNELVNTSNNISINKSLDLGINNITLSYNGSQNYSAYNLTRQVNILEIPFNLNLNKQNYKIGEQGLYEVATLTNSSVKVTILDANCSASGFIITLNETNFNSNYPATGKLYTNKHGEYCVIAEHLDYQKEIKKDYVVENSIDIRVTGDLIVRPNQETNLLAEAKDGISPYTFKWILDDGFKEVSGNKLEETFTQTGDFDVVLEVTDSKGNKKEKELVISVKNQYKLTITVKDKDTNSVISGAEVRVEGNSKLTPSNGKVDFDLFEGVKRVRVFASNYNSYDEDFELNSNKEVEVLLTKNTPVSTTQNQNKIQIISPLSSQTQPNLVKFELDISPPSTSICKLYLASGSADWFEEIKSFTISSNSRVNHTEELAQGEYNWRMECEGESTTYSTQINSFTVAQQTAVTTTSSNFDAGNLRSKIEEAQTNINSLSFEDQKAAAALDLQTQINRALRDFDRALRDINSLMFRRDLSQEQINQRISEYQEILTNIELTTPSNIQTGESRTFVDYPSQEFVSQIASTYQDQKNIAGNTNPLAMYRLQDKIVVQTQILNAQVTYINGSSKDMTIITKSVEYKDNTSRNEFLLEKIPSEIGITASNINFLSDVEIISNNPLVKLGLEDNFTYYFNGHTNLDIAEQFTTIILSDSAFARTQRTNFVTGFVTGVNIDVGTPIWSIIVLIILIIAYLFHAFDVFDKLKGLLSKSSDKKVHQIKMLINDANDYLDTDNLDRANLIFKEIKYNYEKANSFVKKQVYQESIKLYDSLNTKYLTNLLADLETASSNNDKDNSVVLYNKIIESSSELEPEAKRLVNEKLSKIHLELTKKFPEVFTSNE